MQTDQARCPKSPQQSWDPKCRAKLTHPSTRCLSGRLGGARWAGFEQRPPQLTSPGCTSPCPALPPHAAGLSWSHTGTPHCGKHLTEGVFEQKAYCSKCRKHSPL